MKFKDRIYGDVEITEPVLVEIIDGPTLQRLKGVDQIGYPEPYFPGKGYSRFEHSVGVCLLLKKYGASVEEQIAGLIHDASHSAFSHCIDYVFSAGAEGEKEHTYQDDILADYIKKTEIPEILKKYRFDLEYILDDKNFPLKEKDLPDLCADRIDYSLRSTVIFGEMDNVDWFLDNITTENGDWIFTNLEAAKKYAKLFIKLNSVYYSGLLSAKMLRTTGDYVKHALSKDYISTDELYTTDKEVLLKIESNHTEDKHLKKLFDRMNGEIKCINNKDNYDVEVFCKSRIVDPLCEYDDKIIRISEIDRELKSLIEKESEPKKYFLKFDK